MRGVREGPWGLESDLTGKNATFASPTIFVGLVEWADRVLTEWSNELVDRSELVARQAQPLVVPQFAHL